MKILTFLDGYAYNLDIKTHFSEDIMRITDVLRKGKGTLSFEIFPPKGDFDANAVRALLGELAPLSPSYLSVTYSAGGSKNSALTAEIAEMTEKEFYLPSVSHITVINNTPEEVSATIDSFAAKGIENVLALRGDKIEGTDLRYFAHATDIIPTLVERGFTVGASCYPEGHATCISLDDDIRYMKMKQDMGASYFVSQLCFDNRYFFDFFSRIKKAGVDSLLSAGIMPIMSKAQVNRMIYMCAVSLPGAIIRILNRYDEDKEGLLQAGLDYAAAQIAELYDSGVDDIHFYTMNRPDAAKGLVERLRAKGYLK